MALFLNFPGQSIYKPGPSSDMPPEFWAKVNFQMTMFKFLPYALQEWRNTI